MNLTEKKGTFDNKKTKISDVLLPLSTVMIILGIWFAAAYLYGIELIIPKPQSAFKELGEILGKGEFWASAGNTLLRAVVAFAIGFCSALVFALLSRASVVFRKMFYPVVVILRSLPTISVIFICYIALKGWFRAVLIAFLVIFPTLYASFYTALENCSGELEQVVKVYNVSRFRSITKFVIPSVRAYIFSDVVNTISLTVKLIIAAEAVTQTVSSIGGLMAEAKSYVDMAGIFAYTIVAVAMSYFTELVIRLSSRIIKEASLKCRLR